jgi:hypothetical protein
MAAGANYLRQLAYPADGIVSQIEHPVGVLPVDLGQGNLSAKELFCQSEELLFERAFEGRVPWQRSFVCSGL